MRAGTETVDSRSILLLSYNETSLSTREQRDKFRKELSRINPDQLQTVLSAQSLQDLERLQQSYQRYQASDRVANKPIEERIVAVMAAKAKLTSSEQMQQQDIAKKSMPVSLGISQPTVSADDALIERASRVLNNGTSNPFVQEQANNLSIILPKSTLHVNIKTDPQNQGMFLVTVKSEIRGRPDQVAQVARSDLDHMVIICMAHAVNTPVVHSQPAPPIDRSHILNEKFTSTRNPEEFITLFNALPDGKKQTVLAQQRVADLQQLIQVRAISAKDKQTISEMTAKIQSTPLTTSALMKSAEIMLSRDKSDPSIQIQAERMGLGSIHNIDRVTITQTNPLNFEVVMTSNIANTPPVKKSITQEQLSQFVRGGLTAESLISAQQVTASAAIVASMPAASVAAAPLVTSAPPTVVRKPLPPPPTARAVAPEPAAAAVSLLSTGITGLTQRTDTTLQDMKQASEKIVVSKGSDSKAISTFDTCMKTLNDIKKDITQFARMCGNRDEQRHSNNLINRIEGEVKKFTDTIKNIVRPSQTRL